MTSFFKKLFKNKPKVDRIAALEARIFSQKKEEKRGFNGILNSIWLWDYSFMPKTLEERLEDQKKDFEELDHKFDLLERYLKIEYYKVDETTATYDWADKTSNEGFRPVKQTYEQMKSEKEKASRNNNEYDD